MDREKALARIRKCMEMSEDTSSPHEAAAAMRQMQLLMKKFDITERELGLLTYGKAVVQCPIQYNRKAMPMHLSYLVQVVMSGIGVKALIGAEVRVSDLSYVVTYYGPSARTEVAKHAHEVLYRACNRAWDPVKTRQRGARTSFMIGWYNEISRQVPAMVLGEEELEKMRQMTEELNASGDTADVNDMKLDSRKLRDGMRAAASGDFKLHRPVQ